MTTKRHRDQETVQRAAPNLGPIPELRVLRAPNEELVGRISAPASLYSGETILVGRREPEFYPADEPSPSTLAALDDSSISRSQLEVRFEDGCFYLEAIASAKRAMRVVHARSLDWVALTQKLVVAPETRLWIGPSVELYLCCRHHAPVDSVPLANEAAHVRISATESNRLVGKALDLQPPAAERLLGSPWCISTAMETRLLDTGRRATAIRQLASRQLQSVLWSVDLDIGRAAAAVKTPRTTFVRVLDRLGIPRASTLDIEDIQHALRLVHGDVARAAESLSVSASALARRLGKERRED